MNKLLIAGIVSLMVVAGIWLAMTKNKTADRPLDATDQAKENASEGDNAPKKSDNGANSFTGTVKDILAKKASMKCETEYDINGVVRNQTIYSDGKNMRLEAIADINGSENKVYVVVKDDWEYIWNDFKADGAPVPNMGMKIKFGELNKTGASGEPSPAGGKGVDLAMAMDFSCQPWVVDSSLFEVPSDIEFNDYTAQTNDLINNAPASPCDACKMMPTSEMRQMCEQQNCGSGNPKP